jgi:hypothetical protein
MIAIAERLASHTNLLETKLTEQTQKMETHISGLEKELRELKKKL